MPQYSARTIYEMLVDVESDGEADNIVFDFWKAVTRYDRDTAEAYLARGQVMIESSITITWPKGMEFPKPTPAQAPILPKREGEE